MKHREQSMNINATSTGGLRIFKRKVPLNDRIFEIHITYPTLQKALRMTQYTVGFLIYGV